MRGPAVGEGGVVALRNAGGVDETGVVLPFLSGLCLGQMEVRKHLPVFVSLPSAKETADEVERYLHRLRESEWRSRDMKFFKSREEAERFVGARVVFVDTETAGTYPFLSVVHLGLVFCRRRLDGLLDVEKEEEFYIEPPSSSAWDRDYRGRYYEGEGLRKRYAGIKMRKRDVKTRLAGLFTGPVIWVGHNPAYDWSLLDRQGFLPEGLDMVLVDTLDLAGWVLPILRRRGYAGGMDLEGLVGFLNGGVLPHGAAHDALADCRNAVFLFNRCCGLLASADGCQARRALRMVDERFVLAELLRPSLLSVGTADDGQETEQGVEPEKRWSMGERWGRGEVGAEEFFPKGLMLRPTQKEMMGKMSEFLGPEATARVMYLEAPTGTGKTYAYLASMLAWAASAHGRRFFVSTYTKALQEQVCESLDRIIEGLPEDLKFSYGVVKGKENYLCERLLVHGPQGTPKADRWHGPESVLAGYLWLYLKSFPEADGEAEGLLPPALERNWVERWSDLGRFCYQTYRSDCRTCDRDRSCALARKTAMLEDRRVPVVVTNHALVMMDAKEEGAQSVSLFGPRLMKGYPVGVFDEGHRIYEAWCSVNRQSLSSEDVEALCRFARRTAEVLREYDRKIGVSGAGELIDRLETMVKAVEEGLGEVLTRMRSLLEQEEGSRSGYPERMVRLGLSETSLALYRTKDGRWSAYPAFLSGTGLFYERGTKALEVLDKALGWYRPVAEGTETYERIVGLRKEVKAKDVTDPVLEGVRTFLHQELARERGKEHFAGFYRDDFWKTYEWWRMLNEVFEDCHLGLLVRNNLFYAACLERDRFRKVSFGRNTDYGEEFGRRSETDGRTFVFVKGWVRGRIEEGDEPEFGDDGHVPEEEGGEGFRDRLTRWEFVVVPMAIRDRIRRKMDGLEKALVVSATLSGKKADGTEFYPWLNGYGSSEIHGGAVLRMRETFRLDEQMFLAVPEGMPLPLEYYNDEFRQDAVLEIWRILAALKAVRTPQGRPIRMLFLFTSRFNLYYVRVALEKARQNPESPLRDVDLFFQEEMSREELRRRFMEETGRPAALFGLRSFGEGFDVAGEENPVRVVVIDKLPFLPPLSEYHQAMTEHLRRRWQLEEARYLFGGKVGPPPVLRDLEMTDYILPLSVTEFRQWAGRLVRKEKDRGLLFVFDGRILRKSYGMMFRRSLHERLRYAAYGGAFLEFKNRNINDWRRGVAEAIPHPFAELAEVFRTFFGLEDAGPVYDHALDKVTEIRLSWLHQPDRITTRKGDLPRYFSSYFMNMMRLLRESRSASEEGKSRGDCPKRMELDEFLRSQLDNLLQDRELSRKVQTAVRDWVRRYAEEQNKDEKDLLRIPLDVTAFRRRKAGPSFADEVKLLADSSSAGAALYDLIVDRGTGWRGTVSIVPEDGRVVYLSQRRISAYVFGIEEGRREELERRGGLRTDGVFILNTGFGKTLCFQIPALMDPSGLTLVFSPLRALMRDHVRRLREGLLATGGHLGYVDYLDAEFRAKDEVLRRILTGDHRTRLLYVNPNRLMDPVFFRALLRADLRRCVIDEVHTMIQWGDEFAPAYNMIPLFLEEYLRVHPGAEVPVFGFTATLTQRHREELTRRFRRVAKDLRFYAGRMDRPEIAYSVLKLDARRKEFAAKMAALERLIREFLYEPLDEAGETWRRRNRSGKMVVFFRNIGRTKSRPGVKQAWSALVEAKVRVLEAKKDRHDGQTLMGFAGAKERVVSLASHVTFFHAPDERETTVSENLYRQFRQFEKGRKAVMLTTEAFGMGVDIPRIRKVVHFDLPLSLDQYCQQTGRSREGGEAVCLWHEGDVRRIRKDIKDVRRGGKDVWVRAVMGYLSRREGIRPEFRFDTPDGLTVMLDYSQLKTLGGGRVGVDRMSQAVWPWLYEAHFRDWLCVRGSFLNWNSWIDPSPFLNTMEVRYAGDEEAAYREALRYLPEHLAALLPQQTLRHLFGVWMTTLRTKAERTRAKGGGNLLTLFDLYKPLKAEAPEGISDAAGLVYACCHDWLPVASVLMGLVKVPFSASKMSARVVLGKDFQVDEDLFNEVASQRERDFGAVCAVLSPDRVECRRKGLVAAFNEHEAEDLHRAEVCCDVCSGAGMEGEGTGGADEEHAREDFEEDAEDDG